MRECKRWPQGEAEGVRPAESLRRLWGLGVLLSLNCPRTVPVERLLLLVPAAGVPPKSLSFRLWSTLSDGGFGGVLRSNPVGGDGRVTNPRADARVGAPSCIARSQGRPLRQPGGVPRGYPLTVLSGPRLTAPALNGNSPDPQDQGRSKRFLRLFRASWRRGRDSNPRRACALNGFRDRPIQPLSHLSARVNTRVREVTSTSCDPRCDPLPLDSPRLGLHVRLSETPVALRRHD